MIDADFDTIEQHYKELNTLLVPDNTWLIQRDLDIVLEKIETTIHKIRDISDNIRRNHLHVPDSVKLLMAPNERNIKYGETKEKICIFEDEFLFMDPGLDEIYIGDIEVEVKTERSQYDVMLHAWGLVKMYANVSIRIKDELLQSLGLAGISMRLIENLDRKFDIYLKKVPQYRYEDNGRGLNSPLFKELAKMPRTASDGLIVVSSMSPDHSPLREIIETKYT